MPAEFPERGIEVTNVDDIAGGIVDFDTVTDPEWSLLLAADGHCPPELYHRPSDPGQQSNVMAGHADVAQALHRELMGFRREVGSPAVERMEDALRGADQGTRATGQDAPDYRPSDTPP